MGWEYSDTDCRYGSVCSGYPWCTAKSRKDCNLYDKDTRTRLQKIFTPRGYYEALKEEYDYLVDKYGSGEVKRKE